MTKFVGSDLTKSAGFGPLHPLGQARQRAVRLVCADLGWLSESNVIAPDAPSRKTLERFHLPHYLDALKTASDHQSVTHATRETFRIGTMENPVFSGLYERAGGTVGGSMLAAKLCLAGQPVFHPAGGTHHGRPDRASGFCYFNDPVFALLSLLDEGLDRVAYVDLDAHHGDGVQDGLGHDPRITFASIHEKDRWPGTGVLEDRAESGLARNAPVPRGCIDSEFEKLVMEGILPHLANHETQAVVLTCGADALSGDPLSGMEISNIALWKAVAAIVDAYPCTVALGGGGYNPWTTTRAWAGLWGTLLSSPGQVQNLEDTALPAATQELFSTFTSDLVDEDEMEPRWISHLDDLPNEGDIRPEIDDILASWIS